VTDQAIPGTGNYFELTFADLPTFGKAPLATVSSLAEADLGVIGVPFDSTSPRRPAARLGPRRIREESIFFHELWNPRETPIEGRNAQGARTRDRIQIVDCGDATIFPFDVLKTKAKIREAVGAVAKQTFPLVLGGDHYVQYPAYQGVCDALPDAKIGIVQIDAHDDSVDDDPVMGSEWCGTNIQRSLEHGKLGDEALAMVGLHGFTEAALIDRHRDAATTVIELDEVREMGMAAAAEKAISSVLRHCDCVYLTVDIDAGDPSIAPGCSAPHPGGFLSHEFLRIVREFGRYEEVVALDLVEVAPTLDPTDTTPILAAHLLFGFIEQRFLRTPATVNAGD
jgi:agmatinase